MRNVLIRALPIWARIAAGIMTLFCAGCIITPGSGPLGGSIEVTNLYRQIYEAAGDTKPMNISIDTLSRAFAGNEIDRVQKGDLEQI